MQEREALTNEELAMRIQDGQREYIPQLWGECKYIIRLLSIRHKDLTERYATVDMDDFMQCGFLALMDAVKYYNPQKPYKFVSYIQFSFKRHIYPAIGLKRGYVNKKLKWVFQDAPISLNEKSTQTDDDRELIDTLEDEAGSYTYEDYEQEEMRRIVAEAIDKLGQLEQAVIRGRYFAGKTQSQLVDNKNFFKVKHVENAEIRAMRILRRDRSLRDLYYAHFSTVDLPSYEKRTPETVTLAHETWDDWTQGLTKEVEELSNGF